MLDKLRSIGKQTVFYGFGSIINKLLGFILIPVYQSHIPISDFGNLVYFETIIVFLTALLNYGVTAAHQRFFYIEQEKKTYGIYLFNNFFGSLFLIVISILPILYFSHEVSSLLLKESAQSGNLQIVMWIVVIEILYALSLQILQYEQKPLQFMWYNVLKLVLTFTLTAYFVLHFSMGIEGILFARLIGGGLTILFALIVLILPRCTYCFNLSSIKQSIVFGFPFVISTIGYTLFMLSDRFMLNWLSTSEQVGKYGFGMKIANFINLIFVQTIGMSYFPSIMRNESKENNVRYYRKMLTYYCFIIAFLVLGFLFFYEDILWVVGKNKEYWEGLKVVPLLSLSFMIMGMNYFVGVGLFLKKQTKQYLIPSFTAVAINVLMNLWLIPSLGMMGAAYAVVVAQIIYTGLLAYFSGMYLKINFEWHKIFLIYGLAILMFVFIQNFEIHHFILESLLKLLTLSIFPIILYKLNFFEHIEIQRLKEGLIKLFKKIETFH